MSDWNELFRLYPRLDKKLSNEEKRGIKKFIDGQVYNQSSQIISHLVYLETTSHVNQKQHKTNIETLVTQVEEKKYIAQEYRREFLSLSNVIRSREARNELHLQEAAEKLDQLKQDLENKNIRCEELEQKICDYKKLNEQQEENIKVLESTCLKLVREKEDSKEINRLSDNILQLKYSMNTKDKDIMSLRKQLVSDSNMTCDGTSCPASRYFMECKSELIAKCEETALLNFKLEERKRKLKEQKKLMITQLSKS